MPIKNRVFIPIKYINQLKSAIPIFKLSDIESIQSHTFPRVLIDFEQCPLREIRSKNKMKFSVINSSCNTDLLSKMNQTNTDIDSIYLGKDYYGVHFAGQLLWRIAEKEQFLI